MLTNPIHSFSPSQAKVCRISQPRLVRRGCLFLLYNQVYNHPQSRRRGAALSADRVVCFAIHITSFCCHRPSLSGRHGSGLAGCYDARISLNPLPSSPRRVIHQPQTPHRTCVATNWTCLNKFRLSQQQQRGEHFRVPHLTRPRGSWAYRDRSRAGWTAAGCSPLLMDIFPVFPPLRESWSSEVRA